MPLPEPTSFREQLDRHFRLAPVNPDFIALRDILKSIRDQAPGAWAALEALAIRRYEKKLCGFIELANSPEHRWEALGEALEAKELANILSGFIDQVDAIEANFYHPEANLEL